MGFLSNLFGSKPRVDIAKRFDIQREAISGTMSKFYMARDRTTDKVVGVKVLDAEKTKALEGRYKGLNKPSEGEISLAFNHPNIVKTLEHGTTVRDEPYIVMEYLEGAGLNSLLVSKSQMLDGRRVDFIRQAAEALGAVHRLEYIHRDICPRNIVINRAGDHATLIDFGLSVPATPPFMQPGIRTGSPNYMAPEVVRRRTMTQSIDIFSFGVMAFEICTFDLPWPRGSSGLDAMKHGQHEPTDIRDLRPKINERLAKAIHACLEATPSVRCESMARFLAMIKGIEHEDEK